MCCKTQDQAITSHDGQERELQAVDGDMCFERGKKSEREGDLETALMWYRKGIDLHHHLCSATLREFTRKISWDQARRQQMIEEAESGDGTAMCILGTLILGGRAGFERSPDEAYPWYEKGAKQGHMYCIAYKAFSMYNGYGTTVDKIGAIKTALIAADGGIALGCGMVAAAYSGGVEGWPIDYHLSAVYTQRVTTLGLDYTENLAALKRDHPLEVAPWDRWMPETHFLVPENVHKAILTWALISRRTKIAKGITPMITSYINTRNGW